MKENRAEKDKRAKTATKSKMKAKITAKTNAKKKSVEAPGRRVINDGRVLKRSATV